MKFIVIIFFSLIFCQQTPLIDLPSNQFSIKHQTDYHSFYNNITGYTLVNQLITSLNNQLWNNDNYIIFQYNLEFVNQEKLRYIFSIENYPDGGQLYFCDNNGNYHGPYLYNQLVDEEILVSGILNSKYITIEYLHPIKKPLPKIILKNIVLEDIYSLEKRPIPIQIDSGIPKQRDNYVILVTGYWPPTNEMIRHFSQNPILNSDGWQGENWEGLGYDIVSFFPEFIPPDCNDCGMGYGDLEVDYQDTSEDYWPIADGTQPLGIITFSRGYNDMSWELEMNTYNRTNWYFDYLSPYSPTPNPPDDNQPVGYIRNSTLPVDDIRLGIQELEIGLDSYIDYDGHAGAFLSEFMGFHGIWYKDLNQYSESAPCFAAGHIHVGAQVSIDNAILATEESIRILIEYLNQFIYLPGDVTGDELINILDIVIMVNYIMGLTEISPIQFLAADLNQNGLINVLDIIQIVNMILES